MKATLSVALLCLSLSVPTLAHGELRVGAAVVDVTPVTFPVLVNGGMTSRSASSVTTRLYARAIVLDDEKERIGIVVVDSCMMPRVLLDEAKQLASQRTKLKPDRVLISATHTHTAPASMSCLGTDADPTYVPYLREKIAESLAAAEANLELARVGWAVTNADDFTALRRWIRRSDRIAEDPFGNLTVRANMHAGNNWEDVTGESGPKDPDLSLISFQAKDGRPIAVLANFSMHYFSGEKALSADYFGHFCEGLKGRIAKETRDHPPFVGIMSHGCSGDIWRRDYKKPPAERDKYDIKSYAAGLLDLAEDAYKSIEYQSDGDLAMAETRLHLKYRVPDKQRLEWARGIVKELGDRPPKTRTEVYAREQIILDQWQSTDVVVQAVRIADIGIATTPNETYALTGLKLKLQSPLVNTMVIELANGGDGYIPPPEQHWLGGYNTWPARSAGLEVKAEPKITEAALQLLERVAKRPRRRYRQTQGPGCKAVLKAKPVAYWRLDEMAGPRAIDRSGNNHEAIYEPGVAFFLEGPRSDYFCDGEKNRTVHFATGRLRTRLADLGDRYSVSLWFWNGMPNEARKVSGWMFSRGNDHGLGPHSTHLGVGGSSTRPGAMVFMQHSDGKSNSVVGRSKTERWTWNHAVLIRDGSKVRVHLNGDPKPEIKAESVTTAPLDLSQFFFGGRCDNSSNWEGRLDEVAVFDRILSVDEVKDLSGQ